MSMKIYVVLQIEDGEMKVVGVTTEKYVAIGQLGSFEFGYVQCWEDGVFTEYFEYDDSYTLIVNPAISFYC